MPHHSVAPLPIPIGLLNVPGPSLVVCDVSSLPGRIDLGARAFARRRNPPSHLRALSRSCSTASSGLHILNRACAPGSCRCRGLPQGRQPSLVDIAATLGISGASVLLA